MYIIASQTSVSTEQNEPEPEHAEAAAAASTSTGGEAASVAPLGASSGLFKSISITIFVYCIESGYKYAVQDVLCSPYLEHVGELFEKEDITTDVLVDMTSKDLQTIGVAAFGHRHKILKVTEMRATKWQDCSSLTGMVYSSLAELNFY